MENRKQPKPCPEHLRVPKPPPAPPPKVSHCEICKNTGRLGYDLCPDCGFGSHPTTPEQVAERLDAIRGIGDPKWTHLAADHVLLAFLRDLGYHTVVEAYNRIDPKWYA